MIQNREKSREDKDSERQPYLPWPEDIQCLWSQVSGKICHKQLQQQIKRLSFHSIQMEGFRVRRTLVPSIQRTEHKGRITQDPLLRTSGINPMIVVALPPGTWASSVTSVILQELNAHKLECIGALTHHRCENPSS